MEHTNTPIWNGKPYHSFDYELKYIFGEKVYKLSLNGGMSCPNRDGTLGNRGCIFCSSGGSGDFASSEKLSITEQIEQAKTRVRAKASVSHYIAYFQAYTNTYAPVQQLRNLYEEALRHPDILALSIATRPDCLSDEVICLLQDCSQIKPIWIELGLQTIHEKTARYIRRGYELDVYERAVKQLARHQIPLITHVILGLPGETREQMLETIRYLSDSYLSGIKLQLLHVLSGTDLAADYQNGCFSVLSMEEYLDLVISCLELLPPSVTIHRLTGDGPKNLLIAPLWSADKRLVLNTLHHMMAQRGTYQGRLYHVNRSISTL